MTKEAIRNQWTAVHARDMLLTWWIRALEVVGLRHGEVSPHPLGAILGNFPPLRLTRP